MPPKNEFVAMKRLESQARLHFLTFEVAATNSESLLHSSCSRYSRCHIRCSLDSAQDANDLPFFYDYYTT